MKRTSNCSLAGSWNTTTSTAGYGGSYKYISATTGTATATVTWTPRSAAYRLYDVSIYYHAGTNRTTDAEFAVHYATGSNSVSIDQTVNDDQWLSIGSALQFNAGRSGNVVLTNHSTAAGVVIADAVKFEYKGDVTPPVMSSVTDDKYTTSTTALQVSWSGSDVQSGISKYRYAVGTVPGMADARAWTDAGAATSAAISGLSLLVNHTYYGERPSGQWPRV